MAARTRNVVCEFSMVASPVIGALHCDAWATSGQAGIRVRDGQTKAMRQLFSMWIADLEAGACRAVPRPNSVNSAVRTLLRRAGRDAARTGEAYSAASIRFLRFAPVSRASTGARNCPV